jgi:hypothetical protein
MFPGAVLAVSHTVDEYVLLADARKSYIGIHRGNVFELILGPVMGIPASVRMRGCSEWAVRNN